ncbi:protein IQ-DOMAIN 9 [Mercurialis annua]|uniref:protein IQ-DOMAIN 9 n=1 Tax=Mercurialis annua TaxID=3986 RepID=UPI00215F32E1|nr:protein IQ-DOMAIN 9 [Mercurialis annua]
MAKKGSGDWFKTIISLKKVKDNSSNKGKGSSASAKSNGFKWKNRLRKESVSRDNQRDLDIPIEDLAATKIQTAFRAYKARKSLRRLKGAVRLQNLTQNYTVKKQATTTLYRLHSWSKIQAEIKSRRQCMVTDGRIRQKRLENQLKLEARLHDLELEWSGGSETMEETLSRIHQREEAAIKRERAMAYAFSHQWRANSSQYLGLVNYEFGKENWGWSWTESWIAARPWETRVLTNSASPKKVQKKQANKGAKNTNSPTATKTPVSSKQCLSNGKGTTMARRLSFPPAEKAAQLGSIKTEEANSKGEQLVS